MDYGRLSSAFVVLQAFANGTKTLVAASIKTSFPLQGISFPLDGKAKIHIEDEKTINISSIATPHTVL
ncbi:hypothetical protein ANCCAN_27029 [Ancylostoma caninum]|uniref:Uncharacterized protein n=1 Tax=Ancylostoma caninum TaxID=29170 RepID=A0A368FAM9_ANCCA|nr:hypothetical protein ANCCAN_27029 [Ancylostoma caninum]